MMEEISLQQRKSASPQQEEPPLGILHERPVEQDGITQFKNFFWNPKEKKLMGRTAINWVKILLFYCVFYLAICGLFAACWCVFYRMLDLSYPYRQLGESRIGNSPGIAYRPTSPEVDAGETVLRINYTYTNKKSEDLIIQQLNNFLSPYNDESTENSRYMRCDHTHTPENRSETSCLVNLSTWTQCTPQTDPSFGYSVAYPSTCVFLKINRIYGWKPECYDNPDELPKDMPSELQSRIRHLANTQQHKLQNVWVTCDGETEEDKSHMGSMNYITSDGFPAYYFPFVNTKGYLSPLVAIKFENIDKNVLVSVECRLWAKNIPYDRKDGKGSIRFQFYVHDSNSAPPRQALTTLLLIPLSLLLSYFYL